VDNNRQNSEQLRGVNLGGWLVLERWMTPSLFDGTDAQDEYGFMQTPGAEKKLAHHRQTFITEKDLKWIASHGLDAVRIPVGYWLLDGDGPCAAGIDYLDLAMDMAGKYDLKVLIDLHGVKGSQNGYDHSGRAGTAGWYKSRAYQDDTIAVLKQLALRYRDAPALWGIELMNEPKINPRTYLTLRSFYRDTYRQLHDILRPETRIVFSDAFMPRLLSGAVKEVPEYPVVMDVHWYQFGKTNLDDYFAMLERRPGEIGRLQQRQPIIIGEWSGMLSHETLAGLSDEEKAAREKQHIERQLAAYASAAGWFYWTYKTEGEGIWNFRWLAEHGVFPAL
jgi:glucan 1,3-beta-glucosidase